MNLVEPFPSNRLIIRRLNSQGPLSVLHVIPRRIDLCEFFPEASIGAKPVSLLDSSKTEASEFITPTTGTSDSDGSIFFPKATYIPAEKRAAQIKETQTKATQVDSVHRMHIQKLGVEPLEDINQLKCRGFKKPKPTEEFPKASYHSGGKSPILAMSPVTSSIVSTTTTTESIPSDASSILMYQPIDFVSTDGRYHLTLQAKEKQRKVSKKVEEEEEFPIIPKQLQSSTKLKTAEKHRTKFSSKITIGDFLIDISGIFNGRSMKKKDLSKLIINGQSYSI
uniref:BRCA2 n=1 Tax=Caenorhabditis tropicalis TaxID=1561998 RepID=A0A1I7UXG0_9PELO